jgi:hypothetical protein
MEVKSIKLLTNVGSDKVSWFQRSVESG